MPFITHVCMASAKSKNWENVGVWNINYMITRQNQYQTTGHLGHLVKPKMQHLVQNKMQYLLQNKMQYLDPK